MSASRRHRPRPEAALGWSSWGAVLAGLVLAVAAGALDWITGPLVSSTPFYLIPVALATWKGGRWVGLFMAAACSAEWLGIDLATEPSLGDPYVPFWNALVRVLVFCPFSLMISEILERRRVEVDLRKVRDELDHQRGILQSVLDSMKEGVLVADTEGRLLLLNPAAERMLGIRSGKSRPATWTELRQNHLRDGQEAQAAGDECLERAAKCEAVNGVEFFVSDRESGEGRWLLANGRPWLDAAGVVNGGMIVLTDITARRSLERQIAEASEREQQKLGQDLHDGLCQQLASMSFAARMLADKLEERGVPEAGDAGKIAELLIASISQAKNIARGLYLVQLDVGGLASALEELAANVRTTFGLNCRFIDRTATAVPEGLASTDLFRIAQEAVNNAVKHASPKHVTILLESNGEQITLTVEDDGCGMPAQAPATQGLGLNIMNYRARMIGAVCSIKASRSGGTVVTCKLPHRNRERELTHVE